MRGGVPFDMQLPVLVISNDGPFSVGPGKKIGPLYPRHVVHGSQGLSPCEDPGIEK